MHIDKQFIDSLLMHGKSLYFLNKDSYYPMQILLENRKIHHYLEVKVLREFYVDNIPTTMLCELYNLEEDNLSEVITTQTECILREFHELYPYMPKYKNDFVTIDGVLTLCKMAGAPVTVLGSDIGIDNLKLSKNMHASLIANNIYSVGELYTIIQNPDWEKDFIGIGGTRARDIKNAVYEYCNSLKHKEDLKWA